MIDGSEKRNRQLAFEFHNSRVFEKRSKIARRNELNSNLKHGPSVLIYCHCSTAEANNYKLAGWL